MIDAWIEILRGYESQADYTHVLAGHGFFDTAETDEEFIEAMRRSFPEGRGMYVVNLMAMIKYGQDN